MEPAAEVDVDRLPLREDVERGRASLAVAVARRFCPAEGQVHFGADRRRIHVEDAGVNVAHRPERAIDVLRVDGRRQPVGDVVDDRDCFVYGRDLQDGDDRSKDLLARDAHVPRDADEDGWLVEEPTSVRTIRETMAAARERRSLLLADRDVAHHLLQLLLADGRAHLCARIQAITDAERTHSCHEPLDEAIVHSVVHDHAAGRGAPLPRRSKSAPQTTLDGEIESRIVHDDDGVLAAHFEVDLLAERRRVLIDERADRGRARERHDRDRRIDGEALADSRPTRDHVHDTRRHTGFFEDADEVMCRERRQLGRLEDDGVAAHERGDDLPRWDRHREVPRRDDRADAERLADRHRTLVAQFRRHGLSVLPSPFPREEERHVDRFLHVAARFVQHLPHLARHVTRERLLPLDEDLGRTEEDLGALRRWRQPPCVIGRRRRGNRVRGILHCGVGKASDDFVGARWVTVLDSSSHA